MWLSSDDQVQDDKIESRRNLRILLAAGLGATASSSALLNHYRWSAEPSFIATTNAAAIVHIAPHVEGKSGDD
jgi:hypothetical protein